MRDYQLKQLLWRLEKARAKYFQLLHQAEDEYERRYGKNPSDVDDDLWIDSYHCGALEPVLVNDPVCRMDAGATEYAGLKRVAK